MKHEMIIGDNLEVMQGMEDESVDLIATDPPFNTGKDFGAYDDKWAWSEIREREYLTIDKWTRMAVDSAIHLHSRSMGAFCCFLGVRLLAMHRILKPTGSIYLHCDSTASHYIKILLDAIFHHRNFQNHIIWRRSSSKNDAVKKFGKVCDHILMYSKSKKFHFEQQFDVSKNNTSYLISSYNKDDNDGKGPYRTVPLEGHGSGGHYEYKGITPGPWGWNIKKETMKKFDKENLLVFPKKPGGRLRKKVYFSEYKGVPISDIWNDIGMVQFHSSEYTGYPTQKPIELYKRIIRSSCSEGGIVLDPFCGCGTTLHAASLVNRKSIGIDINPDVKKIIDSRLSNILPEII